MASFIDDAGNFLYLTHSRDTLHAGSAYDLVVVEHALVDSGDYFTLSCSGMTHFTGVNSDFTPLHQWEREYGLFHEMRRIPFFAKYRAWKTFSVWKKNVKRNKVRAAILALKGSLFLFIPSLRDALLEIQALCQETLALSLLEAEPGKTYELDEFAAAQAHLQDRRAEALVRFSGDVQSLARTACDEVVDSFLRAAKIVADHRMTFMERASLRSECRKLTRFLRLVDFHVVNALRELALESARNALALAAPDVVPTHVIHRDEPPEAKGDDDVGLGGGETYGGDGEEDESAHAPLLRVEVSFTKGSLVLSPSMRDVQKAFADMLQACLKVVGIPDRIFAHPDLALYIMSDTDDAPGDVAREETSVQDLVASEEKWKRTSSAIGTALEAAYDAATDYATCVEPYCGKAQENGDFLEVHKDAFGKDVNLEKYAHAITDYRAQAADFATIPRSADVGILRVDSLALKRLLVPSPTRCLDALQAYLPELMDIGFKQLLDQLGSILPVVTGAPANVAVFVTKKRVVKEAQENYEGYKEAQQKLIAMAELMESEDWPVPEDQKAHLVMADENMTTLDTGVQIAEGREEEDTKRFATEVAEEVPRLKKRIAEVREQLDQRIVASLDERPENVLAFLEIQSDALDELKSRSETLCDYQGELGQDIDEYDTLDEVAADLNLKLRLWRGVKEWSGLTAEWVVTPLSEIDAVELEKHVQAYNKTVFQASKGLPGNPVVPKLKASVETFTPVLPVVVNLRNDALQERHWAMIHDLVGFEIQGDAAFTLGDIINKGVTAHHAEITAIATNATQESVLEEMMAKVTKHRYVGGIRAFVERWRRDLILFQDTLDEWLACQRAWMYLETIFSSPDIIRQLPAAAKQFQAVDKSWRSIMKSTADDPIAIKACCVKDRKETFISHNATLDKIQKSLEEYLETKCSAFPRFYFLSNDELLEILSQSKDPQAVQPHMRKCFDNLVKLDFGSEPGSIDISGMFSGEGERVGLGKNLKARGNVEDWLSAVEARMKFSLHGFMKAGLLDYEGRVRDEWVLDHPGQVVATVAQMMWARGSEDALRAGSAEKMQEWYQVNLDDLQGLIKKIRSDLEKLQRKKIVALVTTDVHARDIVEELRDKGVRDVGDFTWMQQLRYYWEHVVDTEDCLIRHSDAVINYGYEYMGATSRLVITPLTDRCWLTLTGSYGLKLGAAPAGPAGTGKTESSKDLAKAMAIHSSSCSREGRIAGKSSINFMGVEIKLLDHHVIITMNPGYAGRTELPDNLQVCFRPVSMMVPNYALIAEIMLFAEGFGDAKTLSRKMCKLYILCSEQLSQQPHYDYGLRAVKSVLVMAGGLKRDNPDISEDLVLIRALRDSNLPKFLADDIPLFFAIIADLFPGVVVPDNDYGEFQVTLEDEITKAGLQNIPGFHKKVIQMFDIFNIRFGATIYQEVRFEILNPKCITMGELYGEVNMVTQEWRDGLASTIMRRAVGEESAVRKWTVFDGPIDALWIENMNTVLDDNMTLCLANGERIKLKIEMKMLFEVMDLAVASPATVSRIGVVFMTPSDLGWFPYVQSWAADLPDQKALTFQRKKCKEPVGCVDIQLATSCAVIFQSLFCGSESKVDFESYAKTPELLLRLVEKLWFFSFVWSVGGSIASEGHDGFDYFARDMLDQGGVNLDLPGAGLSYDYFVQVADQPGGKFLPWKQVVPSFKFQRDLPYTAIVVPTEDSTRFSFLMRTLVTAMKPVFMTGVTGTGKTVMVQSLLRSLEPLQDEGGLGVVPTFLNFSAQTSSLVTQSAIESKLEKKRKNLLGAPAGKTCIIFVDDINMPLVESYGAQPPVELLRQFLDFKGFYDREKLFWKDITDTMLFTGAAPPGGGRGGDAATVIFESIFGGFMTTFEKDLQKMVKGVVSATIEVYNSISVELLPTPAKFHYSFNLRDISKVFQGLLMVAPSKVKDGETLSKLWLHESQRVFYDRLINVADQEWFEKLACELQTRHLGQMPQTPEQVFGENSVIFADFLKPGVELATRRYELGNLELITRLLGDTLDEYNITFPTQMNLVFFSDAVRHVCRMSRILRQPRGNAMLVGVGGSGKQSTTRMAAFVAEMPCLQIEISRGYGLKDFREDVKKFMITTGVEGTSIVFLFTDTQVVEESMLEDINSILNSGEIPNLFPQDELDKICSDMIPVCDALGVPASRDNCIATFITRVWDKLHIVLCMSPVGDALRVRCRQFPSLINCTTIDWFWVARDGPRGRRGTLASVKLGSGSDELELEHRSAIVRICVLSIVDVKIEQMTVGTEKLRDTNAIVDGLRGELKELAPVLEKKAVDAEAMLKQVAIDQAEADVVREKVAAEEAELSKQSEAVSKIAAEAQAELDVAMPALQAAVKALDSLTKNDIVEVKAFKSPPLAVKVTMEGICIMLERKPDWDEAKKVLGDSQFLDKLKTYDKDNMKEAVIKKIQKYIVEPNMQIEVVTKVSSAAKGLCMWIHAMNVYHKVAKEVGPKREAVMDKVQALQEQCDATVAEKTKLMEAQAQTALRLQNAEKLTSGLSSEGVRWKENLVNFNAQRVELIGDTLLSCAAISYYGPFTGVYREALVESWLGTSTDLGLPCSKTPSLLNTVGDPVKVREWQTQLLPTDEVSTNNAILVTEGKRWPLMIDPQAQANKWIRKMMERSDLLTTTMTDINLLRVLENAIRNGKPLLIEDVHEQIEPALEPLLGDVVKAERPEVERKNVQLLLQMSADKKKLAEIEAEILRRLSEAKGNILDDEELINTLADSKKFSTMINERLEAAEVTKQEINEAREAYRTVATRGSIIYFVISDLGTIDPMYQYSLQYYQVIFNKCLQDAEASKDQEKRLGILIEYSTVVIYGNICRGLFEKDKAVNNFVRYAFGDDLADAPSGKMDEIYDDLDNATPCIFILSKGTDPTGMLFKLAKQKNYSDRLQLVSLGQGQGPAAAALVDRGTRSGDWVLLQNCMLAKSWMHDLELMVFELGEHREKNHPDFRLFLTSSPAPYFPVSNLVKPDEWETCKKSDAYKRLLSGLCFFHANVLERRKFGPLGWNIRYAFDESDLETSMAIMRRFLDEQEVIPWDALRFVTGHINYGGRVTDDWDRRALLCILGIYFNERVMEPKDGGYVDYAFSASGIYKPATTGPLEEHQAYFDTLPAVDQPEIFGMHENANITFNRAESSALMGTILALQPRESSGGGGKSSDDIIIDQIDDIEGKMPENLDEEDKGPTTFVLQPNGLLTSLDTVLLQEMVKFNRLMNRMRSSLRELRRAIGGFVIMSSDLDDMYTAFLNNQLPPIWRKVSFETLKTLGSWGFMTGTLQTYARKHMVAIDTLEYEYEVLKLDGDPEAAPEDGVICSGLNLEGARWCFDTHMVVESRIGEMYTMLPMIHFKPAVGHTIPDGFYACPVYKTAERKGVLSTTGMSTNFVVAVELPSSVAPERWVLAGVAALLNLTD
ncbi:dynein light chain binding protein [Aureococcus anophagefferens]|nr:dynein light chain binding protein [Aureococcus anophagefferens]